MEFKLFLIIAFLFLPAYCADECKQSPCLAASQVQSLDEAEVNIVNNQQIRIISSDGKNFNLPYDVAIQSGFIKNMPEHGNIISLPFKSILLKPLLDAMGLIHILKNRLTSKELYEFVQQQIFNKFNIEQLAQAFLTSTYLEFPELENLFADAIAQVIKPGVSVDFINSLIDLDHWYLIEKFIYLRSNDKKPDINKFSIGSIKAWKLSVNDLIDYKNIVINYVGELDLSNFYLASLNGFKRIPNINNLKNLFLSNNQLTELPENIFNGSNNLKLLSLYGNQLTELPENIFNGLNLEELYLFNNQLTKLPNNIFHDLNNLEYLDLSGNQLTELPENIFNGLNNLGELNLFYNPLNATSKELVRRHGGLVW